MGQLSFGMKLLLLGILILFFIILITFELYEGFEQPTAISAPVRQNKTCSDPEMKYIVDRFDRAYIKDPQKSCDSGFSEYLFQGLTYCLPNCETGYVTFSNDTSFCIRRDERCQISRNLSNEIEGNWAEVCGPLYKTNLNLMSTMGSISSVINTINSQYNTLNSNYINFSNVINSYNGPDTAKILLRDSVFNTAVTSNYLDLKTLKNTIESNYNSLSNKKNRFDSIYNSFDCATYM